MRHTWPLKSNLELAWYPRKWNRPLLVVPVLPELKRIENEEQYLALLAVRVQWMYDREGRPKEWLGNRLYLVEGLSLLTDCRDEEVGNEVVQNSQRIRQALGEAVPRWPVKVLSKEEALKAANLVSELGLEEWMSELEGVGHMV